MGFQFWAKAYPLNGNLYDQINKHPLPFDIYTSHLLCQNSVTADTCVAMEEWVAHPTEHTALDEIIPCVEPATANESLYRSRQVTFQLVNLVNQVITNVSNQNFPSPPPVATPFYYNQSGPSMPLLCNPFKPDLSNRTCTRGEVTLDNANQVNPEQSFVSPLCAVIAAFDEAASNTTLICVPA
jgi:hypothetical protein